MYRVCPDLLLSLTTLRVLALLSQDEVRAHSVHARVVFGRNAQTAEEKEASEVNGPTVTALEQSERETRHTR